MKFEKIMTVLAIALTTIVSVGCMEKDAIAVGEPTTESSIVSIVETISTSTTETTTSTFETTTSSDTTTTTSEITSGETSAATTELASSTTNEVSTTCLCDTNCSCAGTTSSKETTTMTVDEVKPEPTEPTTAEKAEEIVDALITDVSDFLESVETQIETEAEKETRQREFVVYKPSTHYVHRSTCHWVDSTCYEIEDTNGLEARKCTECNPDIEIVTPYVVETTVERNEKASSMSVDYLGNFRITGYYGDGQTASGKTPKTNHTIAMNNAQRKELGLSYGDVIYIDGDTVKGYYTVEDCGCKWGVIDVFCSSEAECYRITSYADAYSNVVINEN